jgi:hypothetical protein
MYNLQGALAKSFLWVRMTMSSVHCSTDVRSQLLVSISFPEVTVFLVVFPYMTLNKTMFEGPIPTSTHALSCEQSLPRKKKKRPETSFFCSDFHILASSSAPDRTLGTFASLCRWEGQMAVDLNHGGIIPPIYGDFLVRQSHDEV